MDKVSDVSVSWPIQEKEFRKIIHKPGRYRSRLTAIKLLELPTFDNPAIKEPKLLFVFEPVAVPHEEDEDIGITVFVRPVMGERGKMRQLLAQLDPSGSVPETALKSKDHYQTYAESFIGKEFLVTSKPDDKGKYNNFVGAVPVDSIESKQTAPVKPATPAVDDTDDIPF